MKCVDKALRNSPFLHWRLGRPDYHGQRRSRLGPPLARRGGEAEPEDLSGNLIVQLGGAPRNLTEPGTSAIPARGLRDVQRRVKHPAIPWMAATLDGVVEETGAVFEAKFMLPWSF